MQEDGVSTLPLDLWEGLACERCKHLPGSYVAYISHEAVRQRHCDLSTSSFGADQKPPIVPLAWCFVIPRMWKLSEHLPRSPLRRASSSIDAQHTERKECGASNDSQPPESWSDVSDLSRFRWLIFSVGRWTADMQELTVALWRKRWRHKGGSAIQAGRTPTRSQEILRTTKDIREIVGSWICRLSCEWNISASTGNRTKGQSHVTRDCGMTDLSCCLAATRLCLPHNFTAWSTPQNWMSCTRKWSGNDLHLTITNCKSPSIKPKDRTRRVKRIIKETQRKKECYQWVCLKGLSGWRYCKTLIPSF